jgi:hypothetical protein
MKSIAFILFILLFTSTAQAGLTAGQVLEYSKADKTELRNALFLGYLSSFWEFHLATQVTGIGGLKILDTGKAWPRSCIPSDLTGWEFFRGWSKWAESHPTYQPEIPAIVSMIFWSGAAYPCRGL